MNLVQKSVEKGGRLKPPLPMNVGYPGEYGLVFQKAVAAWWVGRKDESLSFFKILRDTNGIEPKYLAAIGANLAKLG